MRMDEFREGLEILGRYFDEPGYDLGAEHDTIYVYATDRPLIETDLSRLIELGWHQEYNGRDYHEDFSKADYKPDEGWVAYV